MKRRTRLALVLAAAALLPAWLLATESGLWLALRAAEALTRQQLAFGPASGRLGGVFELREVVYYTGDGSEVRIGRAVVDLRLTRLLLARVQAETLEVETLEVTVGDAPADASSPLTLRAPLRMSVERGRLRDFVLRRAGAPEWRLAEAELTARWRGEWFAVQHLRALTAEAGWVELGGRFAFVDGVLRLDDLRVRSEHGALRADGAVGLGAQDSDVKVEWSNLAPPQAPWFASARGAAQLTGPWRGYRWRVEGEVAAAELSGTLSAAGRGDLDGVTLEQSLWRVLGGSIRASGRFGWRGGPTARAELDWRGLDPGKRFPGWPGRLNGRGQLRGVFGTTTPALEFEVALAESQLRGYPFDMEAVGTTRGGRVGLDRFRLQSGASVLQAQGQLLPEFAVDATLASPDLRSLWAGLAGRADAKARLRGTRAAPRLELSGTARELGWRDYRAERASLTATIAPQGRSALNLELDDVRAPVLVRGVTLAVEGTPRRHEARLEARGEAAQGSLALSGAWRGGAWRGLLADADFAPEQGTAFALEEAAAVVFAGGRLGLDPACLAAADGGGRVCAQAQIGAARQYFALRTRRFELRHLQGLLPPDWTITGTLDGTAAVTLAGGELHDVRADLAGSAGALAGAGLQLDYGEGSLRVQPEGKNLRARLQLAPGGGEVLGDIVLAPAASLLDRALAGSLRLHLPDLNWLPVLSPEIARAEGALSGALTVGGTLRRPALDGRIDLSGGRIQLATPGIEFTEIAAAFESSTRAPLAITVSARAGEGHLKLEGELTALRPAPAGRFALTGDNAQLFNTAELRAWVTPDLKLALGEGRARLTGELNVTGALITPRELGSRGIAPSGDQVLVGASGEAGAGLAVESEVRIVLGQAVRFNGLGLKTRLTGAITAIDAPGRPTRAHGEFQLVGGRYKAYGQELEIESGRLLFTGGPVTDPAIDITAFREPREDIRVELHARGTLDGPQFTLTSVPAMAQEEQLSWLVLGRSLSETIAGGGSAELAGAATSLGLTGGNFLAQNVGTRLGFDQVSVGARPGETADKARFTIGKYLSPKLFVSYGVGLFQPGSYFRLQYDLGRGFKLSGESGVTSGGDVLYTIER